MTFMALVTGSCSPSNDHIIQKACPLFLTLNRERPYDPEKYRRTLIDLGMTASGAETVAGRYFSVILVSDINTVDAYPICEAAIRGDEAFLAKAKATNNDASIRAVEAERENARDRATQGVSDAYENLEDSLTTFQRGY
jgi:hypothetical protein